MSATTVTKGASWYNIPTASHPFLGWANHTNTSYRILATPDCRRRYVPAYEDLERRRARDGHAGSLPLLRYGHTARWGRALVVLDGRVGLLERQRAAHPPPRAVHMAHRAAAMTLLLEPPDPKFCRHCGRVIKQDQDTGTWHAEDVDFCVGPDGKHFPTPHSPRAWSQNRHIGPA